MELFDLVGNTVVSYSVIEVELIKLWFPWTAMSSERDIRRVRCIAIDAVIYLDEYDKKL